MTNTKTPAAPTVPIVGMGATICLHSDRHAYTVCEVINPRKVYVQQDKAVRVDRYGMSDCQDYRYERNPDAPKVLITLRKDGRWHEGTTLQGARFAMGVRDEHYDYSF